MQRHFDSLDFNDQVLQIQTLTDQLDEFRELGALDLELNHNDR
jgi:hypothetical protein